MRILVTGGAGFIGSHLVHRLQERGEVRVLDNLRTGRRENLAHTECRFIEGSVTDRDVLREAMAGVHYVFHLAAMVSVPESLQAPVGYNRLNTEGTIAVLEEAARAEVRKVVFSSSCAVYGEHTQLPLDEDARPLPLSPYAVTKLDGEHYCNIYGRTHGLHAAALRYFNVYGPRQDPNSPYAAAIPNFISRALRNEPLRIFGDGAQTRDFVYVDDVARANEHLAFHEATGVFNVGSGHRLSVNQLAETVMRLTGSSAGVDYCDPRPGDIRHSHASIAHLRATGFEPAAIFEAAMEETVQHFRLHR